MKMLRHVPCITSFVIICFLIVGQVVATESTNLLPPESVLSSHSPTLDLTHYVNPFIGTSGHGHTFPGPTLPFGMVQLSPDTRLTGWDGCSGYHYSDSAIYGFSHTHL